MGKKISSLVIATVLIGIGHLDSHAAPLSVFQGYKEIAGEDTTVDKVNPGVGGQAFDAEYLFYKTEGNRLYLGLQTGFDIIDGEYKSGNQYYYAGDLALSFDGNSSQYEYAIDFGLYTEDYNKNNNSNPDGKSGDMVDADTTQKDGKDNPGIYNVTAWNNDIYYLKQSSPYAMEEGSKVANLAENSTGSGNNTTGGGTSNYRIVAIDLFSISQYLPADWKKNGFTLDLHWTMSCGNDAISGQVKIPAPVPEPATMLLFGSGLIGFAGIARRRMTR